MTRGLRQRHRRTVVALIVVLPLAFVAAILARRPVPISGAPISDPAWLMTTNKHAGSETGAPR